MKYKGGKQRTRKEYNIGPEMFLQLIFSDSSRCQVGVHNFQLLSNRIISSNLWLVLKPFVLHLFQRYSLGVIAISNSVTKLYRNIYHAHVEKSSKKNMPDKIRINETRQRENITKLQKHVYFFFAI